MYYSQFKKSEPKLRRKIYWETKSSINNEFLLFIRLDCATFVG